MTKDCPLHGPMPSALTSYGERWACAHEGCTVVCWGGDTSTPADAETRALRQECHRLFDPLFRTRKIFRTRNRAYSWLCKRMGVPYEKAHIGMLDAEQCRKLLAYIRREFP